ncbi:hypothetical protein [Streptomyces sp.]|uniref:hypothetical protein n=1 Tax=Streptomyces sp. TaxID=1931 RepID=UPI002F3FE447
MRACKDIGAESGVWVQVTDPEPGVVYRVCAGHVCGEGKEGGRGSGPHGVFLWVHLPDSVGATQASVRFTATPDGSTRPTADERATVTLKKVQPNGPHCPPAAYQGGLTYSRDKGLATGTPSNGAGAGWGLVGQPG